MKSADNEVHSHGFKLVQNHSRKSHSSTCHHQHVAKNCCFHIGLSTNKHYTTSESFFNPCTPVQSIFCENQQPHTVLLDVVNVRLVSFSISEAFQME